MQAAWHRERGLARLAVYGGVGVQPDSGWKEEGTIDDVDGHDYRATQGERALVYEEARHFIARLSSTNRALPNPGLRPPSSPKSDNLVMQPIYPSEILYTANGCRLVPLGPWRVKFLFEGRVRKGCVGGSHAGCPCV